MAKYYSREEAQQKLGMSEQQIRDLVRQGQLHEYRDSGRVVFRAEEVDGLAAKQGSGEIMLEPVEESEDQSGSDVISVEEIEQLESKGGTRAGGKDDTVITSVGISVFDDEELPAAADPMAKTQIRPPSEEETITEEPMAAGEPEAGAGAEGLAEPAAAGAVAVGEIAADPLGPAFTGLTLVSVILLGLVGVVSAAVIQGVWPEFLETLYRNSVTTLIGAVGLAVVALLGGWLIGRRTGRTQPAAPQGQ
ncbi:MAG: helix-turn-helix domain-containing protein [Phycisphaerae bacterium]